MAIAQTIRVKHTQKARGTLALLIKAPDKQRPVVVEPSERFVAAIANGAGHFFLGGRGGGRGRRRRYEKF